MLTNKKLFALALLLSTTLYMKNVHALEQALATISNDDSKNTYELVVDTSEENGSIKTFYKDIFLNGKKTSRESLDYKVLIQNGMVLEKRDKYIIMSLKSDNFDEEQGGIITVDTLYNGANGSRKEYDISMA